MSGSRRSGFVPRGCAEGRILFLKAKGMGGESYPVIVPERGALGVCSTSDPSLTERTGGQ